MRFPAKADTFLMVAPTGARRTRRDHPRLPVSIAEIIADAIDCRAAGADAIHLHVRDTSGDHTLNAGLYREALAELNGALPGFAVQLSTEAGGRFEVSTQAASVEALRPDWISISIREMARDPARAARLYAFTADIGCRVQHILYDTADIELLRRWQEDGTIASGSLEVIHVLGRYDGSLRSDPHDVSARLEPLQGAARQMLCAFGPEEHACLLAAARFDADLRVGFENSLWAPDGSVWRNNAASVAALRARLAPSRAVAS